MNSDLTFITNEENRNLLERFRILINDTRFFDVLVGYFYTSGFHALYKSLEKTEKHGFLLVSVQTCKPTTYFNDPVNLTSKQLNFHMQKQKKQLKAW